MSALTLGIRLTLLAGRGVPVPLPAKFIELVDSVEVTENSGDRSGFQITFGADRGDPPDLRNYPLLASSALKPFSRVVVVVTFNTTPAVLIDGFVTHQELLPADGTSDARFVVTGEDVSVMMDLEEKTVLRPGQNDMIIATTILAKYAKYGVIPSISRPSGLDQPLPIQRAPAQHDTDLGYLREMAGRYGFVFHVTPGPVPLVNRAYWGPPPWSGTPQPALSVAMNQETNATSISIKNDGLAAAQTSGVIQNPKGNRPQKIDIRSATLPTLSRTPAIRGSNVRKQLLEHADGLTPGQSKALAQGMTNDSVQRVVEVQGELDALAYGGLLRAKKLVGLRGTGMTYDGTYYVSKVTHILRLGECRQKFTLQREGVDAKVPLVRV